MSIIQRLLPLASRSLVNPTAAIQVPLRQSQWSPKYVEPITTKEEWEAMKDGEQLKELHFKPVRAALNHQNFSSFSDPVLERFTNHVMMKGHKALARLLMTETFAHIKRIQLAKLHELEAAGQKKGQKTSQDSTSDEVILSGSAQPTVECNPMAIFRRAVDNMRPLMVTRPIKRGGATYQVPFPLKDHDSLNLTMRWLRDAIRDRPKPRTIRFPEALAKELIDGYYNEGRVVRKKLDMHKLCEANKAYAHYRWG